MTNFYSKEQLKTGSVILMSAQFENIDLACNDVDKCLIRLQLQKLSFGIQLVIREALANAIKHGSQNDESKQVILQISKLHDQLIFKIKDEGSGFDQSCLAEDLSEELSCCGRGIIIMRQYFDKVTFNKQGNEVELIKKI